MLPCRSNLTSVRPPVKTADVIN